MTRWPTSPAMQGFPPVRSTTSGGAKTGIDVTELETINFEFLTEVGDGTAGTPTVYDIDRDQKIDIYDNDWLSKLMQR